MTGVPAADLTSAKVELTGHIIGALEAPVKQDGSFEFPAVTPGSYRVRVPQVAAVPASIVVIGWEDTDVQLRPRGRAADLLAPRFFEGCSGRRTRRVPARVRGARFCFGATHFSSSTITSSMSASARHRERMMLPAPAI